MKKLLCLLFAMLVLCGCDIQFPNLGDNYDPPQGDDLKRMPEKTCIGANTFGCYRDQRLLAIKGRYQAEGIEDYGGANIPLHSLVNGFYVTKKSSDNSNVMMIKIFIGNCTIELNFTDLSIGKNKCRLSYSDVNWDSGVWGKDSVEVDITHWDQERQIICGEFKKWRCKLNAPPLSHSENARDTILTFTYGQFDVKYGVKKLLI